MRQILLQSQLRENLMAGAITPAESNGHGIPGNCQREVNQLSHSSYNVVGWFMILLFGALCFGFGWAMKGAWG